jgi:hypothetical protein
MQLQQNLPAPALSAVTILTTNDNHRPVVPGPPGVAWFIAVKELLLPRRPRLEEELAELPSALEPALVASEPKIFCGREFQATQGRRRRGKLTSAFRDIFEGVPLEQTQILEMLKAQDRLLDGGTGRTSGSVVHTNRFHDAGKLFPVGEGAA